MRPVDLYREMAKQALFDPRDVVNAARHIKSNPIGKLLYDAVPGRVKRDAFSVNKKLFNAVFPRAGEGEMAALKAHMEARIPEGVTYHSPSERLMSPFHHPVNAAVATPELAEASGDALKQHAVFADERRVPFYMAHELGHASAPELLRKADAFTRRHVTNLSAAAQAMPSIGLAHLNTLAHLPTLASEAHASYTGLKAIHDVHGPAKMMEALPHAAGAYASYLHSALAPHFKLNFLP